MATEEKVGFADSADYGVFIPSNVDDYPLLDYEFRIYGHIVRRAGKAGCYESHENMAAHCRMTLKKFRNGIELLLKCNLIRRRPPGAGEKTYTYTRTHHDDWVPAYQVDTLREEITEKRKDTRKVVSVERIRPGADPTQVQMNQDGSNRGGWTDPNRTPRTDPSITPSADPSNKGTPLKVLPIKVLPLRSGTALQAEPQRDRGEGDEATLVEVVPEAIEGRSPEPDEVNPKSRSGKKRSGEGKSSGGRQRQKPALSQYHPDECQRLYAEVWSPMYVLFRGELDSRKLFVEGFDLLIEAGVPLADVIEGTEYYCQSKVTAYQSGRGDSVKVPPDGIRFFRGKDGGDSYCLQALELKRQRENGTLPPTAISQLSAKEVRQAKANDGWKQEAERLRRQSEDLRKSQGVNNAGIR